MNRTVFTLLLLLLISNGAWVLAWLRAEEESDWDVRGVSTDTLQREIDGLDLEPADQQRADPVLIGTGEGGAARLDAGASEEGKGQAPGTIGPPKEEARPRQAATTKKRAEQEAYAVARAEATAMLKKVLQVEDLALREEGLAQLAAALAGTDTKLVEYSLSALYSMRAVDFDRGAFASTVRQYLDDADGGLRRSALFALFAVEPGGEHQGRLLKSATDEDPRVRSHVARLLAVTGQGAFEGPAAAAALALLSDENAAVRKGTLRGLADARVTPELEERLIEMATDSDERRDAIYFGLSKLKDKSRPVVEALLTHLDDEDRNVRARAHWGLQHDVGAGQQLHVAQSYASRLGKFLSPKSQREALKLIVRYGDDRLAPKLERFAANEMVDREIRTLAGKAAAYLRNRKPR